MNTVWLNGRRMKTRESAHRYLRNKLRLPDYYGGNLDALWDVLSTRSQPMRVILLNASALPDSLGDYGTKLLEVFTDAEKVNPNFHFRTGLC